MNSTSREYGFYALAIIGGPILIYGLGRYLGENPSVMSTFKLGLVFSLYLLASRGLSSYFPKENLSNRSIATLIEQHILIGVLFAAAMTLMQDYMVVATNRSPGQVLMSFVIMSVGFGGGTFIASFLERRRLAQTG